MRLPPPQSTLFPYTTLFRSHQDYPFSILVERLQAARDPSRSPLFQVMFSMHKAHVPGDEALSLFALGEAGARMKLGRLEIDRKSTRLNSSHMSISYAVFCLK